MSEPCQHQRDYTTREAMKSYVAASALAGDAAIERDKALAEVERLTALVAVLEAQGWKALVKP